MQKRCFCSVSCLSRGRRPLIQRAIPLFDTRLGNIKMGRPLNKKFFSDPAGSGFQIACLADVGAGNVTAHIVQQKSNLRYLVAETATPANSIVCQLVQGAPAAVGEMQVVVQPENATTVVQATFTIDTDGAGLVSAVSIVTPGYGYWVGGTFTITDTTLTGNDDAVVTYTVANGSIATANVTTAGTGYTISQTGVAVAAGDAPATVANPPAENARIINARTVKTFEGNTYAWPIVAPLGGRPGRRSTSFTEADLQGS